jgi:putative hydrolase of the HAD superfamily
MRAAANAPRGLPPPPEVLFLDAGNTVVFLDHQAVSDVLAEEGETVSAERLRHSEGPAKRRYAALLDGGGSHEDGWHQLMSALLSEAGLPDPRLGPLVRRLRSVHDAFNLWRRVPPGLPTAFDRARASGMRLAVISNSEGKLDDLFERIGLAGHFEAVIDSALEGVRKPDPEIFHRALRRLRVPAHRAFYVGDIPEVDVAGAHAAGMPAALIDPFHFYPDYADAPRLDSVAQLVDTWLTREPTRRHGPSP